MEWRIIWNKLWTPLVPEHPNKCLSTVVPPGDTRPAVQQPVRGLSQHSGAALLLRTPSRFSPALSKGDSATPPCKSPWQLAAAAGSIHVPCHWQLAKWHRKEQNTFSLNSHRCRVTGVQLLTEPDFQSKLHVIPVPRTSPGCVQVACNLLVQHLPPGKHKHNPH